MLDFKDIESFRAPSDTMKDYVQSERREKYMQMEQKKLEVEAFKRQREVELHESAIMREQLQDQFKKVGMLQQENEQLSFNLETVRNELEKSREIHKKQIDGFTEQIKELMHSVEHHKNLHKRALEDHENNAKDLKAKNERDQAQATADHDEFVEKMKA